MSFTSSFSAAKTYGEVAVQSGIAASSPHKLIDMLFEGLIDSINKGRGAMARGEVEEKGKALGKAARILEEGLKAGLNLEQGGELADNLRNIYDFCIVELTTANLKNDEHKLEDVLKIIEPIASAWKEIGPQVH
ncbi:flagellar export chaperone FliS [Comamonas sp. NoAH]|uniref:flagellar export chaperone FliS n=1 Tax=Comamonas halotolerans TaxID=3041496 RepID=UPI0024E07B06|nr:flagellar export chaperone FliS [Comamonas sp. NoAH]